MPISCNAEGNGDAIIASSEDLSVNDDNVKSCRKASANKRAEPIGIVRTKADSRHLRKIDNHYIEILLTGNRIFIKYKTNDPQL